MNVTSEEQAAQAIGEYFKLKAEITRLRRKMKTLKDSVCDYSDESGIVEFGDYEIVEKPVEYNLVQTGKRTISGTLDNLRWNDMFKPFCSYENVYDEQALIEHMFTPEGAAIKQRLADDGIIIQEAPKKVIFKHL